MVVGGAGGVTVVKRSEMGAEWVELAHGFSLPSLQLQRLRTEPEMKLYSQIPSSLSVDDNNGMVEGYLM